MMQKGFKHTVSVSNPAENLRGIYKNSSGYRARFGWRTKEQNHRNFGTSCNLLLLYTFTLNFSQVKESSGHCCCSEPPLMSAIFFFLASRKIPLEIELNVLLLSFLANKTIESKYVSKKQSLHV